MNVNLKRVVGSVLDVVGHLETNTDLGGVDLSCINSNCITLWSPFVVVRTTIPEDAPDSISNSYCPSAGLETAALARRDPPSSSTRWIFSPEARVTSSLPLGPYSTTTVAERWPKAGWLISNPTSPRLSDTEMAAKKLENSNNIMRFVLAKRME